MKVNNQMEKEEKIKKQQLKSNRIRPGTEIFLKKNFMGKKHLNCRKNY